MIKITEIRGIIFSATLSDGSALCLQSGESAKIKKSLYNDSLVSAKNAGLIKVEEIAEKENKTGGAK